MFLTVHISSSFFLTFLGDPESVFENGKFLKKPAKYIFSIELKKKKKNLHSNKLGLMWSVLSQIRPAQGKGAQPVIWKAFEATCTCIH